MLPYRQPARGAEARSASLKLVSRALTGKNRRDSKMPHTDTNISRNALQNYGMQPTRNPDGKRYGQGRGSSGEIRIYGDSEETNQAKVYVDVLAEFTREGFLRK